VSSKKILMLAYTFPPFYSEGGSIRVVKFLKYLSASGWHPSVITVSDREELATQTRVGSEELLKDIPPGVKVYRTKRSGELALRAVERRREAMRRRSLSASFVSVSTKMRNGLDRRVLVPDPRIRWLPHALRTAQRVIKREKPDILFVTCPPHSAALIGALLKVITHLPLIVDYRDDWIGTPWFRAKPRARQLLERGLEKWVVKKADRIVVVTEWSRRAFLSRYRNEAPDKFVLIPNGCDLEDFRSAPLRPPTKKAGEFWIVYAGILPPWGSWRRNPVALLRAVSSLRRRSTEMAANLKLVFTGHLERPYEKMVRELGLQEACQEVGHLDRIQYINLLRSADLLLAVNYDDFSTLIPGKIYEYWAASGAPIILLGSRGAASDLIEHFGIGARVDPYDVKTIEQVVEEAFKRHRSGNPMRIKPDGIDSYDRKALTAKLIETIEPLVARVL